MLKSHVKFHSSTGKRQILAADCDPSNREMLGSILAEEYDVIFAANGAETLEQCRANRDSLSLVLLDLSMPDIPGMEILKQLRGDDVLSSIPVIVIAEDQESEKESLNIGAADYITRPYPIPGIILARILRTIELHEDREIIHFTERDHVTGLYNREYFFSYADQFDRHHEGLKMDAIVVDICRFQAINERYGKETADDILKQMGQKLREIVYDSGGIVCRREADTFLIYCPHREDYEYIFEETAKGVGGLGSGSDRLRFRMGVYSDVDKSLDIELRFDRAQMAANQVRRSPVRSIGYYNAELHEKDTYNHRLINDFHQALDEDQFVIYFQPQFDIRPDTPKISGCEALVRWQHPEFGLVNPGDFIPLFENNGLIRELDKYVWEKAACHIKDWKERLGFSVPVSVNVSRVDMYDPDLISTISGITKKHGISGEDLILEITESAYAGDSDQIIDRAKEFRDLGFHIEMDDFGSGYSSLSMISSLPIDALKLDMQFIQNSLLDVTGIRMLEVIIDLASHLAVPVIAEGVETAEQLRTLKTMGCDMVQGFYFSKPVPAEEFEKILQESQISPPPKKAASDISPEQPLDGSDDHLSFFERALLSEKEENSLKDPKPEQTNNGKRGFHLSTTSFFFVIIAIAAAAGLFFADISVTAGYRRMLDASNRYITAETGAANMEAASDYLTDRVRCYVVTGEIEYLKDYFEEAKETRRRDKALESFEQLFKTTDSKAYESLAAALDLSYQLMEREYLAMRLKLESVHADLSHLPDEVVHVVLSSDDKQLSDEEKSEKAQTIVFDNTYMHYKDRIRENVSACTQELIRSSGVELEEASTTMAFYVNLQTIMTLAFLVIVIAVVIFIHFQIKNPLVKMVDMMQRHKSIPPSGAEELQFVSRTYNTILAENQAAREKLSHAASHDNLTGLFNRGAYEMMLKSVDTNHIGLLLIDIDHFKDINDNYGHDIGDLVLKKVAETLKTSFRSVDIICRIGGDEFVVIMTRADQSMKELVQYKIAKANEMLMHPTDELPPISLSVGVAFSNRENPKGNIFKDADTALYRVKKAGRCGCEVY